MPSSSEIRERVARETEQRQRLAVPAFGGGFLYLLSALIIYETLNAAPTVGLLQGLAPALSGVANPAVSPRTPEVKFISHHAFSLIAGGTLAAISFAVLTLILLLLLEATRFRRPETWGPARIAVIVGGVGSAIISIAREAASAVQSHSFAVGHDHSIQAAENALSSGALNSIVNYVGLLATLALTVGMIATLLNALRVGLVVRWMGILGMFAAVLTFAPLLGEEGEIVLAFWMVMMGVLYIGKWPNGEPPAWAAGEARPWPSQAELRASKGGAASTPSASGAAAVPAPVVPVGAGSSRKRRRKRGGR
ncbi:MAG TPA: hypothetical protein VGY13_13860 [Solirubrobacteraceae bacterium]|jgi:hypothetical protein|nr:hypothetical protein [Solirubrobacteraceae bacterium]